MATRHTYIARTHLAYPTIAVLATLGAGVCVSIAKAGGAIGIAQTLNALRRLAIIADSAFATIH
ncbi:MAG: hypothetical protein EBR02_00425 [Alphaproteobacteria bacterium]|nr:hypothetical protein [Alphaproteobacteria bacterium]